MEILPLSETREKLVKRQRWIYLKLDRLSAPAPEPHRSEPQLGTVEHTRKDWGQGRHTVPATMFLESWKPVHAYKRL